MRERHEKLRDEIDLIKGQLEKVASEYEAARSEVKAVYDRNEELSLKPAIKILHEASLLLHLEIAMMKPFCPADDAAPDPNDEYY